MHTSKKVTCLIVVIFSLDALTELPNIRHSGGNKPHKTILITKGLVITLVGLHIKQGSYMIWDNIVYRSKSKAFNLLENTGRKDRHMKE